MYELLSAGNNQHIWLYIQRQTLAGITTDLYILWLYIQRLTLAGILTDFPLSLQNSYINTTHDVTGLDYCGICFLNLS